MSEKLLSNPQRAGIYYLPATRRSAIEHAARQLHFTRRHLEITPEMSIGSVLAKIGEVLHFPDWYGANLDALHDCLTDPECLPGTGHVLTVSGCEHLLASAPDDFAALLEALAAAIDDLRETGIPLWVLLDNQIPPIQQLPAK